MTEEFPRPGSSMAAARQAAFLGRARPYRFDHLHFTMQDVRITTKDCLYPAALIDSIVDRLATPPDGIGVGYCLAEGLSALMPIKAAREFNVTLFADVWARYRARCNRINRDREFRTVETLTHDGHIPIESYGSRWSFKAPHADRNGFLFAHVHGPNAGFDGGEVILIDALAYTKEVNLAFDDTMTWSDDGGPQKVMLRAEHVAAALKGYGRRLGQLGPDNILFVNNGPEGLLHGATDLQVTDEKGFQRPLHRIVVREYETASSS